jgi:hypothetical protein
MRKVFQDLTTSPIVRFSESLEPLCGASEQVRPRTRTEEDLHQATVVSDDRSIPRNVIDASETRTRQHGSASGIVSSPEVSTVARAMKVLNLHEARPPGAGTEARQPARPYPARSTRVAKVSIPADEERYRIPIVDRGDDNAGRQPVEARIHESAGGSSDQIRWPPTPRSPANGGAGTPAGGLRMAQGAPRIAALLRSHLGGNDKKEDLAQRPDHDVVMDADATAVNPQPDDNAVDIDLLTEKLAERLEFEVMRMYGTSRRS